MEVWRKRRKRKRFERQLALSKNSFFSFFPVRSRAVGQVRSAKTAEDP